MTVKAENKVKIVIDVPGLHSLALTMLLKRDCILLNSIHIESIESAILTDNELRRINHNLDATLVLRHDALPFIWNIEIG
jgi:hypothetical protein